jgi:hypothetical protein
MMRPPPRLLAGRSECRKWFVPDGAAAESLEGGDDSGDRAITRAYKHKVPMTDTNDRPSSLIDFRRFCTGTA